MEKRLVVFDSDLSIEAYQFQGVKQKFPNHFHEFYVIGFIEKGRRFLSCKQQEYIVEAGDLLLINPYDNHFCEQLGEETLDYRSIHISPLVMLELTERIIGLRKRLLFSQNVIPAYTNLTALKELHSLMVTSADSHRKTKALDQCLKRMLIEYSDYEGTQAYEYSGMLEQVCSYINKYYAEAIVMEELSEQFGVNQFTLIRQFVKNKGVTPHQYLRTVRISKAQKLLEQGIPPAQAATDSGFSDQSHFSRYFKHLIGVTPKQYMDIFHQEGLNA
ncbi:helix-turn-helix domain-containing protein [Enterococcus sp. LJL128]